MLSTGRRNLTKRYLLRGCEIMSLREDKIKKYNLKPSLPNFETFIFEDEEYRQIKEAPDYFISKNGVVISKRTSNPKPIKITYDRHGNKMVVLKTRDNHRIPIRVHRAIAMVWIKHIRDDSMCVKYKDGNKENCIADNLEWVDRRLCNPRSINMSWFEWTELNRYPNFYICPEGHILYKVDNNLKLLNPFISFKGVLQVNINNKTEYVHRLVAETFIPNPLELKYVIFKDSNKTNVNVNNLEWSDTLKVTGVSHNKQSL